MANNTAEQIKCRKCGKTGESSLFTLKKNASAKYYGSCKECTARYLKEYREKHAKELADYFVEKWKDPDRKAKNKMYKELKRFGMNATLYVSDRKCEKCGTTNLECIEVYGERLSVHHVDNDGRHNMKKGIAPVNDNLQVLCKACHLNETRKDFDTKEIARKLWITRRRLYGKKGCGKCK